MVTKHRSRAEAKSRRVVAAFAAELRQVVLKHSDEFRHVLTVQRDEFATFNQVTKILDELQLMRSTYSHTHLDESVRRLWWDDRVAQSQ